MSVEPSTAALFPARRLESQELILLSIDDIFSRMQIRGHRRTSFGLRDELVPKNHDQVKRNSEISRDEADIVEFLEALIPSFIMDKCVEIFEDGDHDAKRQSEIGSGKAKWRGVDELVLFDALGLARLDKANVRHEDRDPRQDAEYGDEINKIPKYFLRIVCHVEKGNAANQRRKTKGVDWHSATIGASEDGKGIPFLGEAVQGPSGNVQVAVGCGENEQEDAAIQESRKPMTNFTVINRHHKRGRGCTGLLFGGKSEIFVIVRYQGSDQEHGENVEYEYTPKGELDGSRDDSAWVLRLADRDTNQLRSTLVSMIAFATRS